MDAKYGPDWPEGREDVVEKRRNPLDPNHHINKALVYTNKAAKVLFLDGDYSFTFKWVEFKMDRYYLLGKIW